MKILKIVIPYLLTVYSLTTCEKQDHEVPNVTISSLEDDDTVFGTIIIPVSATDNEAIEKVELWLDGGFSGIADAVEPYELEWNTNDYENKTYSLTVRAYDVNMNMSETLPININVDNEGPIITIISLDDNETVEKTVLISVNVTDSNEVEKLELWLDNSFSGISDAVEPYELEWNTIGYENRNYSVTIRAYDVYMNMSETTPLNIVVDNSDKISIPATITSTIYVKTEPELRAAVQVDNAYIIIENDITLTNSSNYYLSRGVIINGFGGEYGYDGKTLYANGTTPSGAFFEMNENSEIWGIRLIGNNSTDSKGIRANNVNNIQIKNCEITGFTASAIEFGGNTTSSYKMGYISSNYIHDNQQSPYGYGILINRNSEVYISKNKFKNNRHHVTGRDLKDNNGNDYLGIRYEASHNKILANTENENAHFDIHGNESYGACLGSGFLWDHGQAGNWIKIHHNLFFGNNETHVLIRGVPTSTVADGGGYQIYSNDFGPSMNNITTCETPLSILNTSAVSFTDQNIITDDNLNKYVTIYSNY